MSEQARPDATGGREPGGQDAGTPHRRHQAGTGGEVMGGAEPAEQKTDVMGGGEPAEQETDVMGGAEPTRD